jgi:soluble lytic murein transglycosylase
MIRARFVPVATVTMAVLLGSVLPAASASKPDKPRAEAKPTESPVARKGPMAILSGLVSPAASASKPDARGAEAKPKQAKATAAPKGKPGRRESTEKSKQSKTAVADAKGKPSTQAALAPTSGAKGVPMPRAKPAAAPQIPAAQAAAKPRPTMVLATASAGGAAFPAADAQPRGSNALAYAPNAAPTGEDIDALREALALARKGKAEAALERAASVRDTTAQKLTEWVILRSDDAEATFHRYARFIQANPGWPSLGMLRRRAEGQLWHEKRDPATVHAFFASTQPASTKGRLALARALLAQGDRARAQHHVREAWRQDSMSAELEAQVLENFGELISRADHKARMDRRLYDEDSDDGMRAAQRLGGNDLVIARARMAVINKAGNAGALLEAVPNEARTDAGYIFSRAQWLRRNDRIGEAAQLMLSAPNDPAVVHDTNEWWVERRLIARKLLDADNPQAAYRVARDAATPAKENSRVEHQFTAGWIALRFLNDPITAQRHFAQIAAATVNPISLARGAYWQGRAFEAAGRSYEARQQYETAARYPTAYYGQLARARLGRTDIAVRRPEMSDAQRAALRNVDVVRAVELLYAVGERDLVIPFVTDLAEKASDIGALVVIAEIASRSGDARATLHIGKAAQARGFTFDHFAFPGIGIPKYAGLSLEADRSVVYAIARQESMFNPRAVSTAKAMGLMQVTPGTGRLIAKKNGVGFDQRRLLSDPGYNAQMGAAELGDLIQAYDGNYILVFVGYNAGRGRVKEWVARYGDPRSPDVDPVDWVERIPFSETRNYVQRVMENMQVYRARFGSSAGLTIEADLRGTKIR